MMNRLWRRIVLPLTHHKFKHEISIRTIFFCVNRNAYNNYSPEIKINSWPFNYETIREKSIKKKDPDSDNEDEENFDNDSSLSRDSKVLKFHTTSMRTDIILKSSLGIARNKIEQMFYESKIRINGKKVLKKSASVQVGDEIDVIKSISPKNSDHLYIARVEILNVTAKDDNILVTARRFKSLLIENYEGDPYKASSSSSE